MFMSAEGGQIPPGGLADIVQEAHPSGSPNLFREPLPDQVMALDPFWITT
jgi:hypothetical protein